MNGLLKMYLGIVACSLVGVGSIHAQSETDAFSLSRTEIDGSARFQAMGGAFAALGGDLSYPRTQQVEPSFTDRKWRCLSGFRTVLQRHLGTIKN